MVGLTRIRDKAINFCERGVGPDIRSGDAVATVPGDDTSEYSTATHFLKANKFKEGNYLNRAMTALRA